MVFGCTQMLVSPTTTCSRSAPTVRCSPLPTAPAASRGTFPTVCLSCCALRTSRPPPSVTRSRQLISMETTKLKANGRHDPCVVSRPIPIMETMTALVLADIAYVSDPRGAQESHPQLPKEIRFCFCDAAMKARCCKTACSRGCPHRRPDRRLSRRIRRRQRRSLLPSH